MDIKETLINQLKKIVKFLNKQNIDYALAGGLAFSALVEPRATMDIDIILMIKEEQLSGFTKLLEGEFESIIAHKEPMHFNLIKIWRVINFTDDREMIFDFILAESKYHKNVIERAFEIDFFETTLKVITLEDLILLKNCAKRAQDIADLNKIYKALDDEINHEYLKFWSDKLNISLYGLSGDIL
ncbi:MAG: nucleotidyltransferase [Deltaproteobacteria bacterium]|nr:nucleotidyltransferase [Deltaproteobacteria bacterium]MBW2090223.1 nucleotidyltransferase [Deltaproteobacteria bacterium]